MSVTAVCKLGSNGIACTGDKADTGVNGIVTFEQVEEGLPTKITYRITGLTPGLHGFHIHEKADFSNGCISAGPHYNPYGKSHGGPTDKERHVGDLGNVEADGEGVAAGVIVDNFVKLSGEFSIIGRSIMVHVGTDDLGKGGHELSSTTGNAGGRIACGEITLDAVVPATITATPSESAAKADTTLPAQAPPSTSSLPFALPKISFPFTATSLSSLDLEFINSTKAKLTEARNSFNNGVDQCSNATAFVREYPHKVKKNVDVTLLEVSEKFNNENPYLGQLCRSHGGTIVPAVSVAAAYLTRRLGRRVAVSTFVSTLVLSSAAIGVVKYKWKVPAEI